MDFAIDVQDDEAPVVTSLSALTRGRERMPAMSALQERHPGSARAGAAPGIDDAGRRAAGRQEDKAGLPFVGPAGRMLDARARRGGNRSQAGLRHQRGEALQARNARQAAAAQAAERLRDRSLPLVAGPGARDREARGHRRARGHGGAQRTRPSDHDRQGPWPRRCRSTTAPPRSSPCIRRRCCGSRTKRTSGGNTARLSTICGWRRERSRLERMVGRDDQPTRRRPSRTSDGLEIGGRTKTDFNAPASIGFCRIGTWAYRGSISSAP